MRLLFWIVSTGGWERWCLIRAAGFGRRLPDRFSVRSGARLFPEIKNCKNRRVVLFGAGVFLFLASLSRQARAELKVV